MHREHRIGSLLGVLVFILLIAGCAAVKQKFGGQKPVAPAVETTAVPSEPPQWMTTGDALGVQTDAEREDPMAVYLSTDPVRLRNQLAARCTEAVAGKEQGFLPVLIAEIYRLGVDPAIATEALLKADCGSLSEVVQGMVAEGGEAAVTPVAERALFLAGPGAEGIIESAATSGLGRDLSGLSRSGGRDGRGTPTYALAYFPARSGEDGELGLGSSYGAAMPGYGIYTFILLGQGYAAMAEKDQERYRELLRLVQSYVLAAGEASLGPEAVRHAFLVPVRSGGRGEPLVAQADPALSATMRDALAKYFDQTSRTGLADRLRKRPGPFLVSSLEPRLVPASTKAPHLVTDLSDVGPEYMYAVVDAYDRRISEDDAGSAASFEPIRKRLVELFALVYAASSGDQSADQSLVTLVGKTVSSVKPAVGPSK